MKKLLLILTAALNASAACVINTTSLPLATVGSAYSTALASAGCVGNFTLYQGALPVGVTLSGSGVISGIPTLKGEPHFTVLRNGTYKDLSIQVSPTAAVQALAFGNGPKITWYTDNAHTHLWPFDNGGFQPGQTLFGALSAASTATSFGTMADATLTVLSPTSIRLVAKPTILPCVTVAGLQPLPCNEPFFTSVAGLPEISHDFIGSTTPGDPCRPASATVPGAVCQGDQMAGTGNYLQVEPPLTDPAFASVTTCGAGWQAGEIIASSLQCYGSAFYGVLTTSVTSTPSVMSGNEPLTRPVFNNFADAANPPLFPENRPYKPDATINNAYYYDNRQTGAFRTPGLPCNTLNTAVSAPNNYWTTPFTCVSGGATPFTATPGEDDHEVFVDPFNFRYFDSYNSTDKSGPFAVQQCSVPTQLGCTTGSYKNIDWSNGYVSLPGIGMAGLDEMADELKGPEVMTAALDAKAIKHQFQFLVNSSSCGGGGHFFLWPANSPGQGTCPATSPTTRYTRLWSGQRIRLDKNRTSMALPILVGFTVVNRGTLYPAGQRYPFTVTGVCQDIVAGTHASGVLFIGRADTDNGAIARDGNNAPLVYVTNTGHDCVPGNTPTIVGLPAHSPGGGADIDITPVYYTGPWPQSTQGQNLATVLYNQATDYGMEFDDISGLANNHIFRTDFYAEHSPYIDVIRQFIFSNVSASITPQAFGSPFLYTGVDQSSLLPQETGFPAATWNSSNAGQAAYWMADPTASGAVVPQNNVIKLVDSGSGFISYTSVPSLGTGVGCRVGDLEEQINIQSGMSAIRLPCYVTGDPTNASWTATIVTDPCTGSDSIDATGQIYTTCPSFDDVVPKVGILKISSVANPDAFTYLSVFVVPQNATDHNIRIDSGSNTGQTVVYSAGNPLGTGTVKFVADITTTGAAVTAPTYVRGMVHAIGSIRMVSSDRTWVMFGMSTNNIHAPERLVWQTNSFDRDVSYTFIVPNGNYMVRSMHGEPYNGSLLSAFPAKYGHGFQTIQTNESWQRFYQSPLMDCWDYFACPQDIYTPVQVTNNVLYWAVRGSSPVRFQGQNPFAVNVPQSAATNGLVIMPDTTTPAHWEMGSFKQNEYEKGQEFFVDLSDGVHTGPNPMGAPYPGSLRLYVRPVFSGPTIDPVWSMVQGTGSVNSLTGFYQAPTIRPSGGACDIVRATSQSNAALYVQQKICFAGSGILRF